MAQGSSLQNCKAGGSNPPVSSKNKKPTLAVGFLFLAEMGGELEPSLAVRERPMDGAAGAATESAKLSRSRMRREMGERQRANKVGEPEGSGPGGPDKSARLPRPSRPRPSSPHAAPVHPPSTATETPDTNDAASPDKNATTAPTFSGLPNLPNGI